MGNNSPTVVCTCLKPEQAKVAAAVLRAGCEDTSSASIINVGNVELGSTDFVVFNSPARGLGIDSAEPNVQHRLANLLSTEVIVVSTLNTKPLPDANPADLFITPCFGYGATDPSSLQRAFSVLRAEVGQYGGWLLQGSSVSSSSTTPCLREGSLGSLPHLHYDLPIESIPTLPAPTAAAIRALESKQATTGLCVFAVQHDDACADPQAFRNAIWFAKELLHLAADPSGLETPSLTATECILPARPITQPTPLPTYQFPTHGRTVLLVIPTDNKRKKEVLQQGIMGRAPVGVSVHTIDVPVNSGVGEQPYNTAGADGARNRILNALVELQSPDFAEILSRENVGTVMIASIESYIQTEDIDRPADFAIAIVHNATTNQTRASSSRGVTIAPEYVDRARRFGTDGDANHGNITVGKVLAARVPQLDHADWNIVVAGISRYDLLKEAVASIQIPW